MAADLAAATDPVAPDRRSGRFAAAGLATLALAVVVLAATVTGTGVPAALLRFVGAVAAAGAIGALVVRAFFGTSPAHRPAAPGPVAARGRWAAWVGVVATALLLLIDAVADRASLAPDVVVTVLALVVALGCSWATRWRPVVGLLLVAVIGLSPPVIAGRASSGPDLDLATNALLLHVVAAAMWLGVRLTAHGTDAQRYHRFSVACWAVLVLSGVVATLVLVPLARPFGTALVWLVVVDLAAVAALGVVALRRSRCAGGSVPGVETGLLVVTVAAVTGLVDSPPARTAIGPVEEAIGYRLPGAPGLLDVLVTWRPDLLLGTAAVVAAALYLAGVRRLRGAGRPWSTARSASWMTGCAVVVLATSSGVGAYAPAVFSGHMVAHMALNMVAPLALVLGAPVTLALRASVPARSGESAGPHEWLLALVDSPAARVLAHPGLAAVAFGGSYYLLYLTGLFEVVIAEHWSRTLLNVVILAIGYQFCWVVAGADAAPRRLPHLGRLGVVFAVMPFHVIFAVLLITRAEAVAGGYYRMLGLPVDLIADQQLAGVLSLVLGELMLITTQVVLLVQWYRYDQLAGFRADPGDDEAAAYRDMLSTLRRSRGG